MRDALRILQVSTADAAGGAERVGWSLFDGCRSRGHACWLAVGRKASADPDVFQIEHEPRPQPWARPCWALRKRLAALDGRVPGAAQLRRWLLMLAGGRVEVERELGHEDMLHPGSYRVLELPPQRPDIVHCHNLHGDYFDLRALRELSRQLPVALTLHDAWLLSGHCAHSLDCERWRVGCGCCPDLSLYPAVRRDATARNWRLKQRIYAASRLAVATPCQWLMDKVDASMLGPCAVSKRVIPNGVDLSVFKARDALAARAELGLPPDAKVLLFAANTIRRGAWKDYATLRAAVATVAERLDGQRVLFLALGEDAPPERAGKAEVQFVPFQRDANVVATYYQAADVYLHAARADTFPNTVLEALACGTPVVATAVGGIPEQIKPLAAHARHATGALVPPADADAMAFAAANMLGDPRLLAQLSDNASRDARERFALGRQVDQYLQWYREVINTWVRPCAAQV